MPAPTAGVDWRPLAAADAKALRALLRASEKFDEQPFVTSLDDVRQAMADPNLELARDSIGGWAGGRLVCFGAVRTRQIATRRRMFRQDGSVHPDWRRRGLGNAVMAWTEERSRERLLEATDAAADFAGVDLPPDIAGADRSRDMPAGLQVWCEDQLADRRALFEKRGYRPVRYYHDMRRKLTEPILAHSLPDELQLATWSAEIDEQIRIAHNSAFEDHWGSEPLSPEEWRHFYSGSPIFRPDLTLVALDGDRV